jgi:hypothetical protein
MDTTYKETTCNAAISRSADSMLPMASEADTGRAGNQNTP